MKQWLPYQRPSVQTSPITCSSPLFSKSIFFRAPHIIFCVNWSVWNHLFFDENPLVLSNALADSHGRSRPEIMFKFKLCNWERHILLMMHVVWERWQKWRLNSFHLEKTSFCSMKLPLCSTFWFQALQYVSHSNRSLQEILLCIEPLKKLQHGLGKDWRTIGE